jgi:hypothetical protein
MEKLGGGFMKLLYICVWMSIVASCAGSKSSDSGGGKQGSGDGTVGAPTTTTTGVPTATTTAGGSITPAVVSSCDAQWALAQRQQPAKAKFSYSMQISVKSFINPFGTPIARYETITSSSDAAIVRTDTISDPIISQYASGLQNQTFTLAKDKFIQSCQTSGGLPVALSGVQGEIVLKGQTDDSITLGTTTLKVKKLNLTISNVKLGTYTISGDAIVYVSSDYPGLPLKQSITITQASQSLFNGAVISDQLSSALPTAK